MFRPIEPLREEEELIELMVELVHIFLRNAISKCGQLKKHLMLERKEKPDKLPREKSLLGKNDPYLNLYLNAILCVSGKIKNCIIDYILSASISV